MLILGGMHTDRARWARCFEGIKQREWTVTGFFLRWSFVLLLC